MLLIFRFRFAIAENAYRDMVEENKDHCILISGKKIVFYQYFS